MGRKLRGVRLGVESHPLSNCYQCKLNAWSRHFISVGEASHYKKCIYNGDIKTAAKIVPARSGPVAKLANNSMERMSPDWNEAWRHVRGIGAKIKI